jgi:hypothetical protein
MKRGTMLLIAAGVCLLAFQSQRADATLITISIEAEVDSVEDLGNYLEGKISPGDIITGTYTYESTTPDSSPLDPIVGHYYHYSSPAGISLNVAGFTFQTDPMNVEFLLGVGNNGPSGDDIYWLASYNNLPLSTGVLVDRIVWQLNDTTGTAFSNDALPTTAPILGEWQENLLRLQGDRAYAIDAHVTSAIPEPGTLVLLSLGGLLLIRRDN